MTDIDLVRLSLERSVKRGFVIVVVVTVVMIAVAFALAIRSDEPDPPLQTHLLKVDHQKWIDAYDENDLEVVQTYNIALLRTMLAKTMARVADLEQCVQTSQDPNEVVEKSAGK